MCHTQGNYLGGNGFDCASSIRPGRHSLRKVRFWPILLKKSAMVSTAEKYALEIEIFTLSKGLWTQISRSCAQKRRFQQSVRGQSGRTDFFNTIGR